MEHGHNETIDVRAQSHLGRAAGDQLSGIDIAAVFAEQSGIDHVAGLFLVNHGDIDIPLLVARCILG